MGAGGSCRASRGFHAFLLYGGNRQWQDGNLPSGHRRSHSARQRSDRPGTRNQPDAADDPTLPRSLRRRCSFAQPFGRRRTWRPVAARVQWAGSSCRWRSQRFICTDPPPWPHRHRRGARRHLQARSNPALPRPRCCSDAGTARRDSDHPRLGDAVPGKLAQCGTWAVPVARFTQSGARPADAAGCDRPPSRAAAQGAFLCPESLFLAAP